MDKQSPQMITSSKSENKSILYSALYRILDVIFILFYAWVRFMVIPISFVLNLGINILEFFGKIARLGLAFVMNGILGVQKTLRIGAFSQKIHYAVLKQNGQYLKLQGKTLQEIFTCQLYDYGIRKFMSISHFEADTKATQIQFWSNVGLNFLKQKCGIKQISALTNRQDKVNRFRNKMKDIHINVTDYSNESTTPIQKQDVFIFFNRSRQHEQHKVQIDMIKILGYIKKNLHQNGYAVIGNYFHCEGDMNVFEELLDGFGFKIQMKEDITPNIIHSRKVLGRIYKNRKIAWAIGKVKEVINNAYYHNNFASNSIRAIWKLLQDLSGVRSTNCKYNLYIIEHAA